jgi:hypothetical protein
LQNSVALSCDFVLFWTYSAEKRALNPIMVEIEMTFKLSQSDVETSAYNSNAKIPSSLHAYNT